MATAHLVRVPLSDRRLVERFVRVPWYVHRVAHPNGHWVPPLLLDRRDYLNDGKNPFFEHAEAAFWVAVVGGVDVGRIAAVEDRDYAAHWNEKVGHFGMFECSDDPEVARLLVERATAWLTERGCTRIVGPVDLSMNYTCGVLVEGFEHQPGINMPWNPPYYPKLLEAAGLEKAKDLYQWGIELADPIPDRIVRIAEKVRQREGISTRNFDLRNWDRDVEIARELFNEAWTANWGFVPMRRNEYHHIAKDLKMVLDPQLGIIAEVGGQPVAFALSILDVNPVLQKVDGRLFPFGALQLLWDLKVRKTVKRGRLLLLGLRESYRRRGLDSLLMLETFQNARKIGLSGGQIGWTLEDNTLVNRAIENFGCQRKFVYRLYQRTL